MPEPISHPRIQILRSIDGGLPKDESKRLEEHLSSCSECEEYMAFVREFADGIGELRDDPLTAAEPCPNTELLVAYEAGELGKDEARQVSNHILFCEKCTEEFYALRRLRSSCTTIDVEVVEGENSNHLRERGDWSTLKPCGLRFEDRVLVDGEATLVYLWITTGLRRGARGASIRIELDPPRPSWDLWMEPGIGCERVQFFGLNHGPGDQSKDSLAAHLTGTYLITLRKQAEILASYRLIVREIPDESIGRLKEWSRARSRSEDLV